MPGTQNTQLQPHQPSNSNGSRYEFRERLGEGGLGQVFRAWDTQLGREVAIKRLRDASKDEETWKEAQILAALHHPNLVSVYDFGRDYAGSFVVMELVDGINLESSVPDGGVALDFFQDFADQLCRGLAAAHARKIVHRDLKPGNIMIQNHEDGTFTVKILDFGLAKSIEAPQPQTMDQNNSVLGSVFYMAPEQLTRQPVDNRTDIYSLGAIFYYVLTGHPPFEGELVAQIIQGHLNQNPRPLREIRDDLPEAAAQIIHKMLAKTPDERPATIEHVRNSLRAAFGQPSISTTVNTVSQPPQPQTSNLQTQPNRAQTPSPNRPFVAAAPTFPEPPKNNKGAVITGTIALLALAIGGSLWWVFRDNQAETRKTSSGETPRLELRPRTASNPTAETPVNSTTASATNRLKVDPLDKNALLAAVGKDVIAEGTIVRQGRSRDGDVLYLNFAQNFRDSLSLVFFVRGINSPFNEWTLSQYLNKRIRVRGELSLHQGAPQIVIDDFSQIEILP